MKSPFEWKISGLLGGLALLVPLVSGLVFSSSAHAQRAAAPAAGANAQGYWNIRWSDGNGFMTLAQDDGMYCGWYAITSGSYGWVGGTVAGNALHGSWDGINDGGGGLVLNFQGNNITGTSGDTAAETTGHTLTGTRGRVGAPYNFGRRWEGHWNGEASTLTLTQHGTTVTGTSAGSWTGPIEGVVQGNVLVAHFTDAANHITGRFILTLSGTGDLRGASSNDRTACFGSYDLDYHR